METFDVGGMIVIYNFVIGILLMLASEKLGAYAGHVSSTRREPVARMTRVAVFTFGTTVAALSAIIYIAFHLLRIGV